MKPHRAQSESACLAYALWQVGAVDDQALADYERRLAAFGSLRQFWRDQLVGLRSWLGRNGLEALWPVLEHCPAGGWIAAEPDLRGRGILAVTLINRNTSASHGHALGYEAGQVVCPTLGIFASWRAYCDAMDLEGYDVGLDVRSPLEAAKG